MSPVTVIEDGQSGLTVDEIVQIVADDWGGPINNNRFVNAVKRRINRALRHIHNFNRSLRIFRVVGAEFTLVAGTDQYNVREVVENGGFGWDNCVEVLTLIVPDVDSRPLEKIDRHRMRERSEVGLGNQPPMSWFPIDGTRVGLFPAPDQGYVGIGDYLTDVPEVTSGSLNWPHSWDEALLAGVQYYTAFAKMRNQPGSVITYKNAFDEQLALIEWQDGDGDLPKRVVVTRDQRSNRHIYRDNSRDVRRWR